jgi:ribosomal protein S27E
MDEKWVVIDKDGLEDALVEEIDGDEEVRKQINSVLYSAAKIYFIKTICRNCGNDGCISARFGTPLPEIPCSNCGVAGLVLNK